VGVPNVGKSSFINRAAGRRAAETSDRPGVTRGKQWIAVGPGIELLDTPGVLWPRFETPEVGLALAWTGAVRDDILDLEMVAAKLMEKLLALYPGSLRDRYGLAADAKSDGYELLAAAARRRGYLVSGGGCDTERMARVLLDEFRAGKLGRITLERP
jgi:ribosome biogenesis GTPase A